MREYTFSVFDKVNQLGIQKGTENWQRLNLFVSKIQMKTFYLSKNRDMEDILIYFTRDQVRLLLGGRLWKDRLFTLLDAGIIERSGIRNSNNMFQELYLFKPFTDVPVQWFHPVMSIRIINSLNFYYDQKASGMSPAVRKLILPNLRKLTFDITRDQFLQYSDQIHQYNLMMFWNGMKGFQMYDFVVQDDFGGRVHTIVTNLKKELRQFIRLGGKRVFELDIHQCQVMMLDKILHGLDPGNSFSRWYEQINDVYQQYQLDMDLPDREAGKQQFCISLFSDPSSIASKMFFRRFPDIKDMVMDIKSDNYKNMAKVLQTAEVDFFRKVWTELKIQRIPFLTIHDALLIPEGKIMQSYDILVEKLRDEGFRKFNIHTKEL